ncbi:dihydrofolate reductase family protein [Streptomyces sp. NPDC050842]|uniref:dihydrofolate reductase family protein n=1 Tax=Streptomyces sp. NPDC050842 TaxID=3365636 RepID=UPI0037883540
MTEGLGSALAQARQAAGDRDVQISGGADTVRQFGDAGLLDELQIHLAPRVLGSGVRLFDGVSPGLGLEPTRVVDFPQVTHLTYRITSS